MYILLFVLILYGTNVRLEDCPYNEFPKGNRLSVSNLPFLIKNQNTYLQRFQVRTLVEYIAEDGQSLLLPHLHCSV